MQPLSVDPVEWGTTFPHCITPMYEEWLPGLLLRCDEVNHWGSGTTWEFLKRESGVKNVALLPYLSVPYVQTAEILSEKLALSVKDILATTYVPELKRCHGTSQPLPGDLRASSKFRICPLCLEEESQLLKRTLCLPYVIYCPWHETILLSTCKCGTSLHLFSPGAVPFTCFHCGLPWAKLPQFYPTPERRAVIRQILACWDWVTYNGNPHLLKDIFESIMNMMKRQIIRNRGRPRISRSPLSQSKLTQTMERNRVEPLSWLVYHLIKYRLFYDPNTDFWGEEEWELQKIQLGWKAHARTFSRSYSVAKNLPPPRKSPG